MDTQKLREEATDKVAEALGDAYDCTRTWQAWSYGTMGPDDFALVAEDGSRLSEIAEAALAPALAAIDAQAAEIARLERNRDMWRGQVERQGEQLTQIREALKLAYGAMNYMGDILNNMDAVEPEDVDATRPAFEAARAALAQEQGGSDGD